MLASGFKLFVAPRNQTDDRILWRVLGRRSGRQENEQRSQRHSHDHFYRPTYPVRFPYGEFSSGSVVMRTNNRFLRATARRAGARAHRQKKAVGTPRWKGPLFSTVQPVAFKETGLSTRKDPVSLRNLFLFLIRDIFPQSTGRKK